MWFDVGREPVAIVGIGCRFPGAPDRLAFWNLLAEGRNAVGEVPAGRWPGGPGADGGPHGTIVRHGAFLDQIDGFDWRAFRLSPREAKYMDPQHRLALEVAWEALEDAGLPLEQVAGTRTGVFLGLMWRDYFELQSRRADELTGYSATGNVFAFAPGRISHLFGFTGPSVAIDGACAASLASVHAACQSLWLGECSMALAGGVNLMISSHASRMLAHAGVLSARGQCRTFDASADGFVRGEGAGMVVLKPKSLVTASDRVYGYIRGSALSHNGHNEWIMAASRPGQEEALREAYRVAGVDPADVDYVELHGTGLPKGDPIEASSLGAVVGTAAGRQQPCRVGSVKTNIGHLDSAAGIAGLIKVALSLHHATLPPSLHLDHVNAAIPLDALGLAPQRSREAWPDKEGPRLAGVTAISMAGVNAHVVLEGAESSRDAASASDDLQLVPLSARSQEALVRLVERLATFLVEDREPPSLADLAYTLGARRSHHEHRVAFVTMSLADLGEQLGACRAGSGPDLRAERFGHRRAASLCATAAEYIAGGSVDWSTLSAATARCVDLPPYQWVRQRLWVEDRPAATPEVKVREAGRNSGRLERHIQDLVADVLGLERSHAPSIDAGLFAAGVNSLSAVELVSRLSESLGRDLPATLIFNYPTIEKLARHLAADGQAPIDLVPLVPSDRGAAETSQEPIAIVGMACRLPGGANTPDAYWSLLRDGIDAIRPIPDGRWGPDGCYDANPDAPGRVYFKEGGFLDDVDKFDAEFFGISPREAVSLDPQQRLLLEVGWEALEHAGLVPATLAGTDTGIFVGAMDEDYGKLHVKSGRDAIDAYYVTGNHLSFTAGRLAYVLGVHGPTMAVNTACSSSLAAIHLACQSLRASESQLAMAGGVNLLLSPETTIAMCRFRALSPNGRCRTFDAGADGFGQSEGCGVVVLKRLSDARRDGDNIVAVIRGSAANHDGRSAGVTVPNGLAQQALIRKALANAGVTPDQVGYVEAHGTGTPLGDPIEVRAIAEAIGRGHSHERPLHIGSAKSNLGHLDSAAGIAGLIKAVLVVQQGEIPPQLHLDEINPHIRLDELPVSFPTELTPWPSSQPRIAGVSSFGLSGTNVHVIVEQAPPSERAAAPAEQRPVHLVALSARTPDALRDLASRYDRHLNDHPDISLADLAATANLGRTHFSERAAIVGSSVADLRDRLGSLASASPQRRRGAPQRGPVFLFTGQGSQYAGMGHELYRSLPVFRRTFDQCSEILRPWLETPLADVLYSTSVSPDLVHETAYTQPALFAFEYALAAQWRAWGIEPSAVMGHSVGEYVAACVAGVFSLEDGLRLVAERGRLMQSLPRDGAMSAVFAAEAIVAGAIQPYAGRVSMAAVNAPASVVISGDRTAVESIARDLHSAGIESRPLTVSHAFHSPLMEPILDEFERFASARTFRAPLIPLMSNLTARCFGPDDVPNAAYWREHIRGAVRFADGIKAAHADGGTVFLEIGPQPTLIGLGRESVGSAGECVWVPSLRRGRGDWLQMSEGVGALYEAGFEINWTAFERGHGGMRARVVLPSYPFQRERFWIDESIVRSGTNGVATHPLLGERVRSALKEIQFESVISADTPAFLADHKVHGVTIMPGTAYVEMALAAAASVAPGTRHRVDDMTIREALPLDASRVVQTILTPSGDEAYAFAISSLADGERWICHASGVVRPDTTEPVSAVDVSELEAGLPDTVDERVFYAHRRDVGLEYGPEFSGLRAIRRHGLEALARLRPYETNVNGYGSSNGHGHANGNGRHNGHAGYAIHPAALDAGFQLSLAVLAPDRCYLPVGFATARVLKPNTEASWGHVIVREDHDDEAVVDVALLDDRSENVAEVKGLVLKRVEKGALRRAVRPVASDGIYGVEWIERAASTGDAARAAEGAWLVFGDGTSLESRVVGRLERDGGSCTVVHRGEKYTAPRTGPVCIRPDQLMDFHRLLFEVGAAAPRGIVFLWPLDPAIDAPEALAAALRLTQAAATTGEKPPGIWMVTRGAQAAGGDAAMSTWRQAGLWGFANVAVVEHADVECISVDLGAAESAGDREVDALFQTIYAHGPERQFAIRGGQLFVPRLVPLRPRRSRSSTSVRSDASYLITGGFGGLGVATAEWLVAEGARHLILVGRREPAGDAAAAVQRLRDAGVNVMAAQADVSRRDQVVRLLKEAAATLPPLRGIFHSAGTLDDGLLLKQTPERFAHVFAPKVDAAWHLHELTLDLPLDWFVLYSSTASVLGAAGQANYAAANATLDALARWRQGALGRPGLSVNWGPWSEVGMAASLESRDQARLNDQGMKFISPDRGTRVLGDLLSAGVSQAVVVSMDWAKFAGTRPGGHEQPFLSVVLPRAREKDAAAAAADVTRARIVDATTAMRRDLIVQALRTTVARVLRLPAQRIDVQQTLGSLGMDSLMVVELFTAIEHSLGQRAKVTTSATVSQLADVLEGASWT